jgi:hypothetical protein
MRKITSFLALTAIVMFAFVGQSNAQKESRRVDEFSKVSFGISGNLYIKQGSQQSVELRGDDLDEVETDVSNGKLRIKYTKSGWNWNRDRVDVYITIRKLEGLALSGSGKVYGESLFKTDDLDLSVSGSGDLELDIDADNVETGISGSGGVELTGNAGSHEISISGSGKLNAEDLETENYDIRISGSGSCRIYATKEIDASVSGSGSIYYRGDPDKVHASTSGSGKVKKIN